MTDDFPPPPNSIRPMGPDEDRREPGDVERRVEVVHCHICGAMIDGADWDKHMSWHALVASIIKDLNRDYMNREWDRIVASKAE